MIFDWKKIGLWGGGITALGVVGYWLYQYQQTAAANNAANLAAESNDQNQALAALLQQPLSGGGASDSSTEVSGPSVDTGNSGLQALINSILNPSSGTVSATPTQQPNLPSAPVGGGGDTGTSSIPSAPIVNQTPINNQGPVSAGTEPGQLQVPLSTVGASISPAHLMTLTNATSLPQ